MQRETRRGRPKWWHLGKNGGASPSVDTPPDPSNHGINGMPEREQSIYELIRQLEQAWNAGDSKRFASAFAEDADFINMLGKHHSGRPIIEAVHREIFGSIYKGSRYSYTIDSVRFVREDVAIAFLHGKLELSNGNTINARPTLTLAKDQRRWQIITLQNTTISDARP